MLEGDRVERAPAPRPEFVAEARAQVPDRVIQRTAGERIAAPARGVAGRGEPGVVRSPDELIEREQGTTFLEVVGVQRAEPLLEGPLEHAHEPRLVDRRRRRIRREASVPARDEALGVARGRRRRRSGEQGLAEARHGRRGRVGLEGAHVGEIGFRQRREPLRDVGRPESRVPLAGVSGRARIRRRPIVRVDDHAAWRIQDARVRFKGQEAGPVVLAGPARDRDLPIAGR